MFQKGQHYSIETEFKTINPVSDYGTKLCTKCDRELSVERFQVVGTYIIPHCKDCQAAYARKWRKKNPQKAYKAARKYNSKESTKKMHNISQKCYQAGISRKEYLEIFRTHNGRCDICGVSHLELNRCLSIDHDHVTGKCRGLLCTNCNTALGSFRDNPDILRNAIEYLERSKITP